MSTYIATFHTHLSAMISSRNLKECGIESRMMPVPREVSSSCGTCLRYVASEPNMDAMDIDVEKIFTLSDDGKYTLVRDFDDSAD